MLQKESTVTQLIGVDHSCPHFTHNFKKAFKAEWKQWLTKYLKKLNVIVFTTWLRFTLGKSVLYAKGTRNIHMANNWQITMVSF